MIDRTLGKHTGFNYNKELKEDTKPFLIPTIKELTLKKAIKR